MSKLMRKESLARILIFALVATAFGTWIFTFVVKNMESFAFNWYSQLATLALYALLPISCFICAYVATREKYHSNFVMEWGAAAILSWLLTIITNILTTSGDYSLFSIILPNMVTIMGIVGSGVLGTIISRDGLDPHDEDEYMSGEEVENSVYNYRDHYGDYDDYDGDATTYDADAYERFRKK